MEVIGKEEWVEEEEKEEDMWAENRSDVETGIERDERSENSSNIFDLEKQCLKTST